MTDTVQAHIGRMIDLLEDPKRWTQGEFAMTDYGAIVHPTSPHARCFCQSGARTATEKDGFVESDVWRICEYFAQGMGHEGAVELNDNTDHATVMEMLHTAYEHAKGAGV